MFNLFDSKGIEIETEDIVKHENLKTDETCYYLCGKTMLYKYDDSGHLNNNSFINIKLDNSVTLVNNEISIWTRLGTEAEVYDEIFG